MLKQCPHNSLAKLFIFVYDTGNQEEVLQTANTKMVWKPVTSKDSVVEYKRARYRDEAQHSATIELLTG